MVDRERLLARINDAMIDHTAHCLVRVGYDELRVVGKKALEWAERGALEQLGRSIAEKNVGCIIHRQRWEDMSTEIEGQLLVMSPREVLRMVAAAYDAGNKRGKSFEKKRTSNKTGRKVKK